VRKVYIYVAELNQLCHAEQFKTITCSYYKLPSKVLEMTV